MAVGELPVGPINLSEDNPGEKDRFKLSEGIGKDSIPMHSRIQ